MEGEAPAPLNERRDKTGGIVPTEVLCIHSIETLTPNKAGRRSFGLSMGWLSNTKSVLLICDKHFPLPVLLS